MMSKSNVTVFTLIPVLFVLLSFVSVSVILAGGTVYESISENMNNNYEKRVTFSYLTTKIHQNDCGNISTAEVNGINMLAIKEDFFDREYVTYIYFDAENTCIREIFLELNDGKTIDFALADGEEIVSSNGFDFQLNDGYAEINMTDANGIAHIERIVLRAQTG